MCISIQILEGALAMLVINTDTVLQRRKNSYENCNDY
jgi:hypothetical protein